MTTQENNVIKLRFILLMEENLPSQNFNLKDLPGASKIDVVSRVILSIFPNYTIHLEPELHVIFAKSGHILVIRDLAKRDLPYDEIEIAAIIRDSLNEFYINPNLMSKDDDLIFWKTIDNFNSYLATTLVEYPFCYYLHERGTPIKNYLDEMQVNNQLCFILGGRHDIAKDHEKIILNHKVDLINLGEKSYLASTCVTAVIYHLETIFP